MVRLKMGQPVYVEWVDAFSCAGWEDVDEAISAPLPVCCSIGFFVHQDKERFVIANTLGTRRDWDRVAGLQVIPKGSILSIERLDKD